MEKNYPIIFQANEVRNTNGEDNNIYIIHEEIIKEKRRITMQGYKIILINISCNKISVFNEKNNGN